MVMKCARDQEYLARGNVQIFSPSQCKKVCDWAISVNEVVCNQSDSLSEIVFNVK